VGGAWYPLDTLMLTTRPYRREKRLIETMFRRELHVAETQAPQTQITPQAAISYSGSGAGGGIRGP
jgi:hypothetical protein